MALQASIELFKVFVAGNQFDKIEGKSGVLVLGRMGSGKSTTIKIQLGAEYEVNESGHLDLVRSSQWTPQTSDGWASKTLQVQLYRDSKTDLLYLDTAGLNENRGDIYRDWTSFSTAMVLSLLKEIKAVIVMVDFAETFGSRGEGLRNLAESMSGIVGKGDSSEVFYNSTIFVFTNAWRNGKPLSSAVISETVKDFLEHETREFESIMSALKDRHGQRTLDSHGTLKIQWEQVPDVDKKRLHAKETSILLLQAMVNTHDRGRSLTSCLTDPKSCRSQVQALSRLINSGPVITKGQLESIVADRETKSLAVNNMLVGILTQCQDSSTLLALLTQRADCIEQLVEVIKRHGPLMNAIQYGDWKDVQMSLVSDKTKKKRELERQQQEHKEESLKLEKSDKMVVLQMDEVREAKIQRCFFVDNLWSWVGRESL